MQQLQTQGQFQIEDMELELVVVHGAYNNLTIINSGLIAGDTHEFRNSIYVSDDNNVTSGFNLITKGEGTYDGKFFLVIKIVQPVKHFSTLL